MDSNENIFPICGNNAMKAYPENVGSAHIIEFPGREGAIVDEGEQKESLRDIVLAFAPCVLVGFLFVL